MSMKMLVSLRADQRLSMSMHLRQAITMLQYSTLELTQIIQQSLADNPLLDVDETEESADCPSSFSADVTCTKSPLSQDGAFENYAIPMSLRRFLLEQTQGSHFDSTQQIIAEAIIDSLDDAGFLTLSLAEIQACLGDDTHSLALYEAVLAQIQTFEPSGVAARDLRECLCLQLNNTVERNAIWHIAYEIIDQHLPLIAAHMAKKIMTKMRIDSDTFSQAIALIRQLNPNPGRLYAADSHLTSEPELYAKKNREQWIVKLKPSLLTNVRVNAYYSSLIKQNRKAAEFASLKAPLEEARILMSSLERRNATLLAVGSYIVETQKDFLTHGAAHMKAMNIADVAQALGVHESTVSRITSGKYIATPNLSLIHI